MARFVANVDVTVDTWETAIQRENTLLDALSNEIITANSTFANTGTPAAQRNAHLYGMFVANTFVAATALRGGSNTSTSANLNITSNAIFTGASVNVSSNTTITGIVNTTANVTATGALLNIFGTTLNVTSNVLVTAQSLTLRANTTVSPFTYTANSTVTNITMQGSTLSIVTNNSAINSNILTVTSNTSFTAANIQFRSNTTVTALSITGNTTATNTTIGGTILNVTSNTAITGVSHTIAGNVNFDSNTLFVNSVDNNIGIRTTAPTSTLSVNGTFNVTETANVTGAATLSNTLTVAGNSSLAQVTASGNATFQSRLAVTGATVLGNTLSVANSVTIQNDLVIDVVSNDNVGSNTVPRLIYSFPKNTYRSGKLLIQASRTGNNQISEMLVVHDDTNAHSTVYGAIASPPGANTVSPLGTFTATINNANVEIFINQTLSNTAVKVVAQLIK